MGQLADCATALPCVDDFLPGDHRGGLPRDFSGIHPKPERQRTQDCEFGRGVVAVEIGARIRFGKSACARRSERFFNRTVRRFHQRQHGVGGAVEDGVDTGDAIAGQALTNRADDRHRSTDRGFEPKLAPLPCGKPPQRGAVVGNHLLIGGDDGFAGE